MKRFFLLTLASAALLGASAAPVKTYEVKSPDGRLALVLTAGERLSFTVARDGETLVAPSEMALTLSTGEVLGESPRVRSARRRAVSETIDAPLYRQSRFDAAYNELDLRLRGDYGILARAYDDGVALRLIAGGEGNASVLGERTGFSIPAGAGDVYGMNIDATNHNANSAFWKRTLSTRDSGLSANGHRKFSPRGYLFPISQEEMDRTNCTQNYGW